MKNQEAKDEFIKLWGALGSQWGINRSMAQIHALLYVTGKPLPADEIAEVLEIARSNVSMSIKELQGWGIVRTVHVLGDRRDHPSAQHRDARPDTEAGQHVARVVRAGRHPRHPDQPGK